MRDHLHFKCVEVVVVGRYVLCEGVLFYRGVRQHGKFYLLDFWFLIRVAALAVMLGILNRTKI